MSDKLDPAVADAATPPPTPFNPSDIPEAKADQTVSEMSAPTPAPASDSAPSSSLNRAAMDNQSMQQFNDLPETRHIVENAKSMLYDRQGFGGKAPNALLASKTKDNPQEYRDGIASVAGMSAILGLPAETVAKNFTQYQNKIEGAMGWDHSPTVGAFADNLTNLFMTQDEQHKAISDLQTNAVKDYAEQSVKGMSPNPLVAYSKFAQNNAFSNVPESQKVQLFQSIYQPIQNQMATPEGQKALQLVNALTQNKDATGIPEVGADTASADISQGKEAQEQPEKIDPVQFLKGMTDDQQNKVISLAAQLMQSKQPEMGNGLKVAGGLGQAFAQGFTSWGAIGHLDDLVEAEKRLKAAQSPEDAQKAQDDIENIKLAQKIKQADQQANMVNPELYGLPSIAYKVSQGVAGMPGSLAPALVPVLGEFAFYKQAQAEDALKLMAQNPNMSAEEAKSRSTIASAAYGITMGRMGAILGEASPGLVNFLAHTAQSTAIMQGAEAERILGRQLQSIVDPSFNPKEQYGQEWFDLLKATPYTFATLAAFGGAIKLMNRGQAPDPNSFGELEKQAGTPRLLQYLGFDAETAQKIASLPEGQRVKALGSLWEKRTDEQKQAGVELARQDADTASKVVADPSAPKVEQTPEGKFVVTTKQGEETHSVPFDTQEGAQAAVQMSFEHLLESKAKEEQSHETQHDWLTATQDEPVKTESDRITEVSNRLRQEFPEGKLPESVQVVHDPDANWNAKIEDGKIQVNAAHLSPEEAVHEMHEEILHAAWGDEATRPAFEEAWKSLPQETQDRLSSLVERLYGDHPEDVRNEETRVKAVKEILKEMRNPENKGAWDKFVEAIKSIWERITGTKAENPEDIAARLLALGKAKMEGIDTEVRYSLNQAHSALKESGESSSNKKIEELDKVPANTKSHLVDQVLKNLDAIHKAIPQPLASDKNWRTFVRAILGPKSATDDVLMAPERAMKYSKGIGIDHITGDLLKHPEYVAARSSGLSTGAEFLKKLRSGELGREDLASLFTWGLLSRGVGAYPQEGGFLALHRLGLHDKIKDIFDGKISAEEVNEWAKNAMDGTAGASTSHNALKVGDQLAALATDVNGRKAIDVLLDAWKSDMTGPELRREIHKIFTDDRPSIQIDNKVLSFIALVSGRPDVMVLDRVQFRHLWGGEKMDKVFAKLSKDILKAKEVTLQKFGKDSPEGKLASGLDENATNAYDALPVIQPDGTFKFAMKKGKLDIARSGIAPVGNGLHGLAIYEAIEKAIGDQIKHAYEKAGIEYPGIGAFHWDSWLVESQQAIKHPTVSLIAKTDTSPSLGVAEGKFNTARYGVVYRYDGKYMRELLTRPGEYAIFEPDQINAIDAKKIFKAIGRQIPLANDATGAERTRPWTEDLTADEQSRFDEFLKKYSSGVFTLEDADNDGGANGGGRAGSDNSTLGQGQVTRFSLRDDPGLQEKASDLSEKDKDRLFKIVDEFSKIDKARGSSDFWNGFFKGRKATFEDVDRIESQLSEWKAYYAKQGNQGDAQEASKQAGNPIQDVLNRYHDGDESVSTPGDLVNELDGLAGELDNQELEDAVREYRDSRRDEREMYGERGGIDDAAFDKLVSVAQKVASEQRQTRFSFRNPGEPSEIPSPKTFREQALETLSRVGSIVRGLPKDSDFKRHLLQWSARSQASSNEVERIQHTIETTIKDKAKRDGITNWIEAGGDRSLLLQRAASSKDPKTKAGYEAAANLTPDELKIAEKVRTAFNTLEARAKKWGIDMGHRENYVPHVYEQEPQAPSGSSPKRLSEFFKFSQERTFETYFGGEQAGFKPQTKDISKLLGLYLNDMNNAINSRRFVSDLSKAKASDGRPLVSPRGSGKTIEGENGEGTVHLIYPDSSKEGHEDYKTLDQPALHDWSFAGKDDNGKNILVKGDLAVHPEVADHFSNALGSSKIRQWWNRKTDNPFLNATKTTAKFLLDDLQGYVKGTMLSFSPFHQVQEGIHAIGHRINPFSEIPKIDLRIPEQADATAHGLMLSHDRLSQSLFMEGVGSNDRNLVTMGLRKIGWGLTTAAADKVEAYQHWLFSQYIPGLKFKTYQHILERNMERFAKEIESGKASEFQVKNLSAQQANAAYGHLNYTEMGHNPTIRHAFQIALLAPDFLEARARFVAQSAKTLAGAKTGSEQLQAFAFLAVTQVVAATIQKVLTNGEADLDHPFEMRFGNKYYGMRSVPEDVYKAFHNPTGFIGGRISPIFGRFVQEGVFGVNYRGEHTTVGDAIKDILAGTIPMPMQSLTRQWTDSNKANPISPFEQILSSAGVQVHRYSPISTMYPIAEKWVKANHPEDIRARGAYPVSKFQQLRYACEDGDAEAIQKEIKNLEKGGMNLSKITSGFKSSVNHPFTGKESHDLDMAKTLSEDDLQTYHAAIERRKVILQRFNSLKNSAE